MNDLKSRPLFTAMLASLGIHFFLLLPWQHGTPWGASTLHGHISNSNNPRLNVVLRPAIQNIEPSSTLSAQIEEPPQAETIKPAAIENETDNAAGVPMDRLYYYAANELDQRPHLKREPEFEDAPNTSLLANGSVVLEILIERDGRINAVNIVRTDLLEVHISPLRKAFLAVEYAPGIKQGQAVRSRVYIEASYVEGVLSPASAAQDRPREPALQTPRELPPDWRKRKENPPLRGKN
jgi:hypothetical protein